MKPYDPLDTLYDFLKNIVTVDEFFAKKEPSHDDEFMRIVAQLDIASGIPEEYVLGGLKTAERRRYAQTQKQRQLPH